MQQILEKQDLIQLTSDPEIFQSCFKPQIRMRIIFTGYAINSASVCFLLTLALMVFDEYSEMFDRVVNLIADYMYIAFGPVLFVFCLFGLASIPELSHECLPTRIGDRLNLMDVCILLVCTALSFSILFIYALQYTNRLAERDLGDEHSVFYQIFITYLKRQRQRYLDEKHRSQANYQPVGQLDQADPEERRPLAATAGFGDMRELANGSDANRGDKEDWTGNGINAAEANSPRGNRGPSLMDTDFASTRPSTFGNGRATDNASANYGSFSGL